MERKGKKLEKSNERKKSIPLDCRMISLSRNELENSTFRNIFLQLYFLCISIVQLLFLYSLLSYRLSLSLPLSLYRSLPFSFSLYLYIFLFLPFLLSLCSTLMCASLSLPTSLSLSLTHSFFLFPSALLFAILYSFLSLSFSLYRSLSYS